MLLLPLSIHSAFVGPLHNNASQTEETLNLALYEGQKKAAVQGRYTEEIYNEIKSFLIDDHHYEPDAIEVSGTEVLTPRGSRISITITVPKPNTTVIEAFRVNGEEETFTKTRQIMSEYRGSI